MKKIILLCILMSSMNSYAMFALHVAYWSGCVQSRTQDLGKTYGKTASFCKEKAKKMKYDRYEFVQTDLIVEESRSLFFQGCVVGNATTKENILYEKCHILTKKYFFDMKDILKQ